MKIIKIMNNNVIFVEDAHHNEIVLVGKGLGFKKKPGMTVDEEKIEKTFALKTKNEQNKLVELLTRVDPEDFAIADIIIQYAQTALGKKLKDNIYITLTDHIVFAMERVKEGVTFSNAMLWEIKRFYPQEFAIGTYAIDYIKDKTGIDMPEDEAGFIALHIANAHIDGDMAEVEITAKIIKAALKIVSLSYKITLDENSLDFGRFVIHLKFCIGRLFSSKMLHQDDAIFIDMIRRQYDEAYRCAEKIGQFIEEECDMTLTEDELVYLTVHIKRITDQ